MAENRMTKQRALILEVLRSVDSHPTADEVYGMVRRRMPRISLGTVYRNLELLAGAGKILRLDRAGSQKHFDGNSAPHQHVRCRVCGRIGDVMNPVALPDTEGVVSPGFRTEGVELEFIGLCDACREGAASKSA
ncbi:MAG: transcriptional repressor [Desulfovibrio sp.]|jgi:Fur family ferric uptake transcriptional regulator|nr:transcriptional repressor [Desulfovibrio sp.]